MAGNLFEVSQAEQQHYRDRQWRALNDHFVAEIERSDATIAERWQRDCSSQDAYTASVAANRQRFIDFLGGWPWARGPLAPVVSKLGTTEAYSVERVLIRSFADVTVDALLLQPTGPVRGAVMVQHGLGGTPAEVCGFATTGDFYHAMGHRLAEHGYVVLAARMLGGPDLRRQIHRKTTLVGQNLFGIEMFNLSRWVDYLTELGHERIGIYGLSQGGQTALWLPAAEPRIACSVTNGWFNHRRKKMIERSEYHVTFMDALEEEDKIYPGQLCEFSDADIASLICPRPFMAEIGISDNCVDYRLAEAEFARVHDIYTELGVAERCQKALFEGAHELCGDEAIPFLDRWLAPGALP